MQIYFEDGILTRKKCPSYSITTHKCYLVDAMRGYSENIDRLEVLLGEESVTGDTIVVYTNSLVALSTKYCWNDTLGVPELYLRPNADSEFVRVDELTDKEIHKVHNLMQMYINRAFKKTIKLE